MLPTPLNGFGPRIIFNRYNFSPNDFGLEYIIRNGVAVNEVLLMTDPYACIHGIVYITDFANATMAHLTAITPSIVKKLIAFYEKSLPLRNKTIGAINLSPNAVKLVNILIQYAPEKIRKRVS